jgi:uncharacterized protein (DUF885 family)
MPETLAAVADDYIRATNAWQPGAATSRGFHEHDGELGVRSPDAIEKRLQDIRSLAARVDALPAQSDGDFASHDRDLLRRRLQWELTEAKEVRSWRRAPGSYLASIGGGCNNLVIRNFAPLEDRVRSLISRLRAAPDGLAQGRANIESPSRYHVETAIEAGTGMRALFERDLPNAVEPCTDAALKQQFHEANDAAAGAVQAYVDWLRNDVLPSATEDFAWGASTFAKLISQTDSIDDPLESLIRRGEEDLRAHQDLLRETAAKIDASASPAEVVDAVSRDHPSPEELLPEVDRLLEELRQFSIDARLCTMPTDIRIAMAETPGFSRMTTQAACSPPGPFERTAKEAYYYVTPPDPSWSPERTEAYLKFFNRWSIPGVTAHEAYPGHYVHLTYLHRAETDIGRYLMTTTTVEGWAHYVEQLMIEAGYRDGDPRVHLMQIREALMRLCRYRCAFGLHAEGWTVQQAIDFFINEGFATPIIAERETRRGIIGPNYYAYTMGKHQILALRDRLRTRDGASFDQRAFHDAFMQLPYPVSAIERIMLEASPSK